MLIEYQHNHEPPQQQNSATHDVTSCLYQFNLSQVQSAIRDILESPLAHARRRDSTRIREKLVQMDNTLVSAANASTELLVIRPDDYELWPFVFRHLQRSCHFQSVSCELCDQIFIPSQIRIEPWSNVSGPTNGEGGKRFLCPNGYILYSILEWIS